MLPQIAGALVWRLISMIRERRRDARRQAAYQAMLARRIPVPDDSRPNIFTALNRLRIMNTLQDAKIR